MLDGCEHHEHREYIKRSGFLHIGPMHHVQSTKQGLIVCNFKCSQWKKRCSSLKTTKSVEDQQATGCHAGCCCYCCRCHDLVTKTTTIAAWQVTTVTITWLLLLLTTATPRLDWLPQLSCFSMTIPRLLALNAHTFCISKVRFMTSLNYSLSHPCIMIARFIASLTTPGPHLGNSQPSFWHNQHQQRQIHDFSQLIMLTPFYHYS